MLQYRYETKERILAAMKGTSQGRTTRTRRYGLLRTNSASAITWVRLLFLVVLLSFGVGLLPAQVDTGSVQGTITDQLGAVVIGATVELRNESTGFVQTTTTDQAGQYLITPVRVGSYSLSASMRGFATVDRTHTELQIQQHLVVDFQLLPGKVTSTVQVTASASELQTQDVSVGQVIPGQQINALPLNGRNYTLLAQLSPGTTTAAYDTGHGEVQSGTFIANGVQTVFNNYLLDGISNNNDTADYLNGTSYALKPPPDALAEFKVELSNYSAEYGRSGGAIVNAVTKSGGNSLFGDLWEYIRNSALDANDYFLNHSGVRTPEYRRNQFGGSLGGPVVIPHLFDGHNKTFFFMDYEGQRIRQGLPYVSSVPTALEQSSKFTNYSDLLSNQTGTQTDILGRTTPVGTVFDPATTRYLSAGYVDPVTNLTAQSAGIVREAFPGNIIPANRISSVAAALLALYPEPTVSNGIANNYVSAPVSAQSFDGFDVRIDQNFSAKDQLFGRVGYTINPNYTPPACPGYVECAPSATDGETDTTIVGAAIGETHVFSPRLVNEARIGYNRMHVNVSEPYISQGGVNQQFGIPGIPDGPGNGGLAQIVISGLSTLGGHNNIPKFEIGSESSYSDNISLQSAHHFLKFGGELERLKSTIWSSTRPHGYFSFTGGYTDQYTTKGTNTANTAIANFAIEPVASLVSAAGCSVLTNTQAPPVAPGCYTYNFVGGAANIQGSPLDQQDYRKPYFGAYVNDTWKLTPALTVDLGLRYEYFSLGSEHGGRAANFVPSFASKDGSSSYLIDDRSKGVALSSTFTSLLASQNIALVYTSNHHLGEQPAAYFAPRVGFAWRVTSKSVIRGGYGVFYAGIYSRGDGDNYGDNYPFGFNVNLTSNTSAGLSNDGSIGPIDKGLSGVPLTSAVAIGSQISEIGIQYYDHVPSVQDMNLSAEYQIKENQYVQIAYVGNLSRHIEGNIFTNKVSELLPPQLPAGTSLTNYLPYPGLPSSNNYIWLEGSNNYNSLQAKYEKTFSHGTNLIADYTRSKALGYGQDAIAVSYSGQGPTYRAPHVPGFGINGDYGALDFDSRDIFHAGGGWQLPFGKERRWLNQSRVADLLVGGWNVTGIVTYQSGQPSTITCASSTSTGSGCFAFANQALLYNGAKTVAHWYNTAAFSNPSPVTTVGQTVFSPLGQSPSQGYGPAFHRGDMEIQKHFHVNESMLVEFRAAVFNLTNTPNFGPPGSLTPGSSSFASITTTRDNPNDPREMQFAVKLIFGRGEHY